MFEEDQKPIDSLVHLYVDGAFNRRELIRRVAAHTGSIAAAIPAVNSYGVAQAQDAPAACPVDASVPEDAPDLTVSDVKFPGEAGMVLGHLAYPNGSEGQVNPAVLVV